MKAQGVSMMAAAFVVAAPFVVGGCEREVARTDQTTVSRNGTVHQKETVVRESPDGTVTREQTNKTLNP